MVAVQLISSEPHLGLRFGKRLDFCTRALRLSLPRGKWRHTKETSGRRAACGTKTNLVVDAFVKQYAKRPPVCPSVVTFAGVDFGSEICQRSGLARQDLARYDVGSNIL